MAKTHCIMMTRAAAVIMVLLAIGEETCALLHETIVSDGGDTIDCVAISHEIQQVKPGRSMKEIVADSDIAVAAEDRLQSWRKGGAVCPAGTVAIRRSAFSVADGDVPPPHDWSGTVETAASYGTNGPYHGLRAEVPFWEINVHPDEFSMSYVMVGYTLDGSYRPGKGADPPASLPNQIMAGLMTWPSVFGDSLPRLFVYYTDDTKMIWWVSVQDEDIGYFRDNVFDTRFPEASYVEMGGRVLNTRPGGQHTTTAMGSTIPACAGPLYSASIKEYFGITAAGGQLFLDDVSRTVTTVPTCYSANPLGFGANRSGFYTAFGGAGGIYCDQ